MSRFPIGMINRKGLWVPPGTVGGGTLPNSDLGRDLRVWMRQPVTSGSEAFANGGILYLPDGTYYGGNLGDIRGTGYAHSYNTALARNGWLTLKAWNPGMVTIDLSHTAGGSAISDSSKGGALQCGDTGSSFGIASMRLAFDDILWQNGLVRFCGTDRVRFWDCRGTFPYGANDGSTPLSWKAQFDACCTAAGVATSTAPPNTTPYQNVLYSQGGVPNYLKGNFSASGIRCEQGAGNQECTNIWMYSCDLHDCGDDGFYHDGTHVVKIIGCRAWSIAHAVNPGALIAATFHNDSIQVTYGADHEVADTFLGQHLNLATESGGVDNWTGDRIWQYLSEGAGISLDASSGRNFTNSRIGGTTDRYGNASYWKWGINGQSSLSQAQDGPAPGSWNSPYVLIGPGALPSTGVTLYIPPNITTSPLSSQGLGLLVNPVLDLVNHSENPAVVWRINNPVTSRDSVWNATNVAPGTSWPGYD